MHAAPIVRRIAGFTLIELLVVISIIALLTSFSVYGIQDSRANARDAKRQADVVLVQNAVELYKNKNGEYPEGCRGTTGSIDSNFGTGNPANWSGEQGTGFECGSGNNEYIEGLAPEFIPTLPRDPRAGADGPSGYVYTTNDDQSVYKFMALNTVERDVVDEEHPLFRCGPTMKLREGPTNVGGYSWNDDGVCYRSPSLATGGLSANISTFPECNQSSEYENDYAVSAGFSSYSHGAASADKGREYDTEMVRCK
jgi:prepilin-type N-terminal cleavage/methylation domain-containing protein